MINVVALDRAVQGVLGSALRDYRKGSLHGGDRDPRDELDERARRAANAIRAAYREQPGPAVLLCRGCQTELDADDAAIIDGAPCCTGCAPRYRLTPPPRRGA